ncbi:MAG TPA: peptidoglycan-binding protein [Actinomycetota bacterium]|nr:peptidoglycan-binding protein [Actinomycetota bacterium]
MLIGFLGLMLLAGLGALGGWAINQADNPVAIPSFTPPASVAPNPSQAPIPTSTAQAPAGPAVDLPVVIAALGPGATGPAVTAFQQRLANLSYMVGPVDGNYGAAMSYAVTAFQKVEGLPRTGVVDALTRSAMQTAGVPAPAYAAPPDHIEVDIAHQVMLIVDNGQVTATVAVSTGTDKKFTEKDSPGPHKAVTPNGVFSVLWKHNGWWTSPLGQMYKPSFIDDSLGIAIHGYPEVPPQPASHGCIRVPMPFADAIYAHDTSVGLTVFVHGGPDGPNP